MSKITENEYPLILENQNVSLIDWKCPLSCSLRNSKTGVHLFRSFALESEAS